MADRPDPADVVGTMLAVLHAVHEHIEAAAASVDLTPGQAMLLRDLDEPVTMREIASRQRCDPSNVTGMIDRLERRELVGRRADPGDRRVRRLVLTPTGRRVRTEFERALATGMPPFTGLGDADAARLLDLLHLSLLEPAAR